MKKNKNIKIWMVLGICGAVAFGLAVNTLSPVVDNNDLIADNNVDNGFNPEPDGESGVWRKVAVWTKEDGLSYLGAEASPAGAGFLAIYFCNNSGTPASAYTRNTSTTIENYSTDNGFDYAHIDDFDLSFTTTNSFDIVVRVKYTQTDGPWNGSGWRDTWVRINITVSGSITISDSNGTWLETYNDSSSQSYYGNVFWDNSGAGYSLNAGDSASIDEISIECKKSG